MTPTMNTPLKVVTIPGSSESAPSLFVDGVAEMNFGGSVCKLSFHQIANTSLSAQTETRKIVMNVSIPTHALVELCVNVLGSMSLHKDQLKELIDSQNKKTFDMLSKVQSPVRKAALESTEGEDSD